MLLFIRDAADGLHKDFMEKISSDATAHIAGGSYSTSVQCYAPLTSRGKREARIMTTTAVREAETETSGGSIKDASATDRQLNCVF